LLQSSLINTI